MNDDPSLTVRHVAGRDPLRVLLDRQNRVPRHAVLFTDERPTLVFTGHQRNDIASEQHVLREGQDPLTVVLQELHRRNIRSVLVEGGAELIGHFLRKGFWDEARVITGTARLENGTRAPMMTGVPARRMTSGADRIDLFVNGIKPAGTWYL